MSQRQVSQWRTVGVVVLLSLLLWAAFFVLARRPDVSDNAVKLFDNLSWGFFLFALTAAGKSGLEHLGNGGGLKGAARALLTDAKPGDPPPPAPPPGGAP
jgi:hypothetical protein